MATSIDIYINFHISHEKKLKAGRKYSSLMLCSNKWLSGLLFMLFFLRTLEEGDFKKKKKRSKVNKHINNILQQGRMHKLSNTTQERDRQYWMKFMDGIMRWKKKWAHKNEYLLNASENKCIHKKMCKCFHALLLKLHQHKSSIRKWKIPQVAVESKKRCQNINKIWNSRHNHRSIFSFVERICFGPVSFTRSEFLPFWSSQPLETKPRRFSCFILQVEYQTKLESYFNKCDKT